MKSVTFEKIVQNHAATRSFDNNVSGISVLGLSAIQFYVTSFETPQHQWQTLRFDEDDTEAK